jgi:RecA-family ATPase
MENKHINKSTLREDFLDTFGLSGNNPIETLDDTGLFIKSGISIIAALAGMGKTTYMGKKKEEWEEEGYSISYVNFDSSPTYGQEMIECPENMDGVAKMLKMIEETANNNDIIIIDSLKAMVSYYGLSIEDNSNMYPFMLELRELVKKTKCSIILVHHVYKAKNLKANVQSFYGSRAIEEQCDSAFIYNKDTVEIVKSRNNYARDEIVKI